MERRGNFSCVFPQLACHAAGMFGEPGIFDTQHDLDIDKQAAQIEIGRTEVDGIVHDYHFRVQSLGFVFKYLRAAFEQIAVKGAARAYGRAIIGFSGD